MKDQKITIGGITVTLTGERTSSNGDYYGIKEDGRLTSVSEKVVDKELWNQHIQETTDLITDD